MFLHKGKVSCRDFSKCLYRILLFKDFKGFLSDITYVSIIDKYLYYIYMYIYIYNCISIDTYMLKSQQHDVEIPAQPHPTASHPILGSIKYVRM